MGHHQMLLFRIEQPNASFTRPDPLERFLQEFQQHFVADAEKILRRNGVSQLRKMFFQRRPEWEKPLLRKKVRAGGLHSGGWRRALVSLTSAAIRCGCSCSSLFISVRSSSVHVPL